MDIFGSTNPRKTPRHFFSGALAVLTLIAGSAYLVIVGIITPLTPSAPPVWHKVHVGMHRSNILALVGAAQNGMYREKIVETWSQDGILGIRKLDVWYQNPGDDRATMNLRVYAFTGDSSQRYIHTRTEP